MIYNTIIKKDERLVLYDYPVGEYIKQWLKSGEVYADIIKKENTENKPVTIVCRGSSGAILATLASQHLENVMIIHVKKEGESAHRGISHISSKSFIVIVDDFVSTGETINAILNTYPDIIFDLVVVSGCQGYSSDRVKVCYKRL